MLREMVVQVTSVHEVKDKTDAVGGDKGISHAHNKRAIGALNQFYEKIIILEKFANFFKLKEYIDGYVWYFSYALWTIMGHYYKV